ncbi:MAG: hypothetical protein R3E89_15625 [Thiolinea sp.]
MNTKSLYSPRVVVASQQGGVLHIKCKQTGRVVLKLKLVNDDSDCMVLLDMCDSSHNTGYAWDRRAELDIAAYECGEVPA